MKTHNFTLLAAAFVLLFWLASPAQAFFDPHIGRWATRDPIREPAFKMITDGSARSSRAQGPNLYHYVGNDAVNKLDVLGLFSLVVTFTPGQSCPYEDPCAEAKSRGLDNGHEGGTVCCNGIPYPCVWGPKTQFVNGTPEKAYDIIKACLLAHEMSHIKGGVSCTVCGLSRGKTPGSKTSSQDECDAHYVEMKCLQNALQSCDGNIACENAVKAYLQAAAAGVAKYCSGASK